MTTSRIISQTLVYDGWYKFFRIELELPGGILAERHLLDNGSAVAILPYDPFRRVCMLIEQPRVPVLITGEPPLLEAIAGCLDGAPPAERIVHEAIEEGGLQLSDPLEAITNMWSLSPVSTERVQLYLTTYSEADLVSLGGGAPDEDECITVRELSLDVVREMVMAGTLTDAKTLILAQALLLRHPELWQ